MKKSFKLSLSKMDLLIGIGIILTIIVGEILLAVVPCPKENTIYKFFFQMYFPMGVLVFAATILSVDENERKRKNERNRT